MTRTSDITSFTDYRRRLREHHDRVRQNGRPLFITSNGEADAVILSPEAFDALIAKAELAEGLASIERGLEDVEAGRVRPFREGIREIAAELGVKLEG